MESVAKKESIKVAHLLLVHHDPLQVKRLLIALQHPDVSFFVHIDKKTDRLKFEKNSGILRTCIILNLFLM